MIDELLQYKIALGNVSGIGATNAKTLISYIGDIKAIFTEKKQNLLKIPGIGEITARKISQNSEILKLAETELEFILKNNIKTTFYLDKDYPYLLKQCPDAPLLLFYKGNIDLYNKKTLSIVGTRKITGEGKNNCNNLIEGLCNIGHNPVIISGLAYGVDICAHKAALKNNLPTFAVLGHGLDRIYPANHASTAAEIIENGAIISEFATFNSFERQNFLRRNRVIAGLSEATVVIESASKGGSLTTADMANSYDREVFTFPGRPSDKYSAGCNMLIKRHRAFLIENAKDIEYILSWEERSSKKVIQQNLFVELTEDEKILIKILENNNKPVIDFICKQSKMTMNKVSATLLMLEFKNLVRVLPGKIYELNQVIY